jgi:NAD(P)-dependent dehydrogenase (short-subunit alcohol dehydrogenase family)
METEQPLMGRVGVVTGASAGIGAATARALAAAGMSVVLASRRGAALEGVCGEIRAAGGRAEGIVTDVRDPVQVDALVDAAVARFARLDAVVANAAIGVLRPVADAVVEEWRAVLETNLLGTMLLCRAALRHFLPQGRGDVVIMGSAAAQGAWPYFGAYAASKAAVLSLARTLRAEVAARGVRVMTLDIHNVAGTGFAAGLDPDLLPAAIARWVELGMLNPAAPSIAPEDVARAVVFQLAMPPPASVHEVAVRSREN